MRDVRGFCPMGCGETLHLGEGDFVYCGKLSCPNPSAVSDILDEKETEHVVTFTLTDFVIRHPLKERCGDELVKCDLTKALSRMGPPQVMGRYRALKTPGKDHWHMERLGP
jgi:hypothetical protein